MKARRQPHRLIIDRTVLSFYTAQAVGLAREAFEAGQAGEVERSSDLWALALATSPADEATKQYCAARADQSFRVVRTFVDIERSPGAWLRVHAKISEPEPDVGLDRPIVHELIAIDGDGQFVPLTTEEVGSLKQVFEDAYYRWMREPCNSRKRM